MTPQNNLGPRLGGKAGNLDVDLASAHRLPVREQVVQNARCDPVWGENSQTRLYARSNRSKFRYASFGCQVPNGRTRFAVFLSGFNSGQMFPFAEMRVDSPLSKGGTTVFAEMRRLR